MPKFSIIIPVYNVEKYLNECLDSILVQEFKDYEIILINDGSTDNSWRICDDYSAKYPFIETIHKENGGLSDARNKGLKKATGEYILFIDSDDYIFENALTKIVETINEDSYVDIVFFDAIKIFPDGTFYPLNDGYCKKEIYQKSHEEVLNHLTSLRKFPGSACTKLVKRSLIEEKGLLFEKGMLSEDIDWTLQLLTFAQKFNYCKFPCYCYRQSRNGSITNTVGFKNVKSLLSIVKKWSLRVEKDNKNEFQKYFNLFMTYEYIIVLLLYKNLSKIEKEALKNEISAYSWLLSVSKDRRIWVVKMIYHTFGIEVTSTVLANYQRLRLLLLKKLK